MLRSILTATIAFIFLLIALVAAAIGALSAAVNSSNGPSPDALNDIPANYLPLYQHGAALCPGLDWAVLAAIGKIETDHGRLNAPGVHSGENFAGAGVISRSVAA